MLDINRHLGQISTYVSKYDPSLLVREARKLNREPIGLYNDSLPFIGSDLWNGYEFSCLLNSGMPVVGIVQVTYPCTNEYIVESKSMKLYWNSFNNTAMGDTVEEAVRNVTEAASKDLSQLLETTVKVNIFTRDDMVLEIDSPDTVAQKAATAVHCAFTNLDILHPGLACNTYTETPGLLVTAPASKTTYRYHSSLLKSNCKVTSQPDWGDVYISYRGNKTVTTDSLLRYIISFRDECHFHEEIIETMFARLYNALEQPDYLFVAGKYVRRGGWDICPTRVTSLADSKDSMVYTFFNDDLYRVFRTARQ